MGCCDSKSKAENATGLKLERKRPAKTYSLKVVVCGNIGVGKTALIEEFSKLQDQKNQASDEKTYNSNRRNQTSWTDIKLEDGDGDTINTKMYDIAGNVAGLEHAKMFDAHCILICYSIIQESSFEEI